MRLTDASLPPADGELWSLVETFVEGGAAPDEGRRLEDRLRGEPAARIFYVAYLDLHAQLQWRTRGETGGVARSEEHTSELQSRFDLVCRLLLEKKKKQISASQYQ